MQNGTFLFACWLTFSLALSQNEPPASGLAFPLLQVNTWIQGRNVFFVSLCSSCCYEDRLLSPQLSPQNSHFEKDDHEMLPSILCVIYLLLPLLQSTPNCIDNPAKNRAKQMFQKKKLFISANPSADILKNNQKRGLFPCCFFSFSHMEDCKTED